MAIVIEPVRFTEDYGNHITCLDSWHSLLLLGTQNEGVLIFDVASLLNGAAKEGSLRFLCPITQLTTTEDWDILLVLCNGRLSVYEISRPKRVTFTHKHTFQQTNIEKFTLCNEGQVLLLCIYVPGQVYIYKYNRVEFSEFAKLTCPYVIQAMVLAPKRLYITHSTSDLSGACSYYNFTSGSEISTPPIFSAETTFELFTDFSSGRALVQQGSTSYILEDNARQWLWWHNSPKAIAGRGNLCIGISGNTVEAVSTMTGRLFQKVMTKDSFQYITNKKDIYIASPTAVWRVAVPFINDIPEEYTLDDYAPPPENFSPHDPLSVLRLGVTSVDYLLQCGISTVQQFAEVALDIVEFGYGKKFLAPRFIAENLVTYYKMHRLGDENALKRKSNQIELFSDLSPEDPLSAIGMNSQLIQQFAALRVFTVRQFAIMSQTFGGELDNIHETAKSILQLHDNKRTMVEGPDVYGFIYFTTSEFSNILDCREIKSAYMMFQEYIDCEPEQRLTHPWKVVYHQFYLEAKGKMGRDYEFYEPSDADVFSYITALHVTSIGKYDATAGSRAIFFHVNQYWKAELKTQAPNLLKINLTALCTKENGGKLYSRMTGKEWTNVTLEEYQSQFHEHVAASPQLEYPVGCIVMPSGTIEWDHIVANILH